MLRNYPSAVENEFHELKQSWQQMQQFDHKITNDFHLKMIHLFHGYLDQVWANSQSLLHCAQVSRSSEGHDAQTISSLSLHLMKQSLKTRQDLVCMTNNLCKDAADYFSFTPQPRRTSTDSFSTSITDSSSLVVGRQRPVRLTSSPSTPNIHSVASGETEILISAEKSCKHGFSPASSYSIYYDAEADITGQKEEEDLTCYICHGKLTIGLKKSFSADNFCTLLNRDDDSSDEEDSFSGDVHYHHIHSDNSSGMSYSDTTDYEEDNEDIMAGQKLLLRENENEQDSCYYDSYRDKLMKYQLLDNDNHGSKLQLDDTSSLSSTGTLDEKHMRQQDTFTSQHCFAKGKRNLSLFFNKGSNQQEKNTTSSVLRNTSNSKFSLSQLFSSSKDTGNKRPQKHELR